jgi:uncharacterized UPF0160 family protein
MKSIIFLLGFLFITNSNAQKIDCTSKIKLYQELLVSNKISQSFESWNEVRKICPKDSEVIYTDGIQILNYKINNANSEEKEKWVRELLKLYDQYNKNFPLAIPDFEVKKAMALVTYKIDSKEEIFSLLDNGYLKDANYLTEANSIYTYFSLYCERYNNGDKKITPNLVLEKYASLNAVLNKLKEKNTENNDNNTVQRAIDDLIKDIATCENQSDYYTKNFDQNKENVDWLTSALISLSRKCSTKPIFQTLAEKLYSIKVTEKSANFMALSSVKQRKFPDAIKYYDESAALQKNPLEKAKIYYTLATGLLANEMPKSKEYLQKALLADPTMGKAYLFLAQLYSNGSKDCAGTDFEKKAINYLAIETAQKATIADPKLKPTVDKLTSTFAPNSLSPSEISKAKMNGKTLTIGCWINETITFPAK